MTPSREAGALTISYVLIVPVFLIGIMTVVQASIWYLARDTVLAAARHGADVARTSSPPPGSGAQAAISFATSATSGLISNVTASTRGTTATTVRITVSARIPSFVPGLVIGVHEVVTAPVERFVALGGPAVGGPVVGGPVVGGPVVGDLAVGGSTAPERAGLEASALARPAPDPVLGWGGSAGSRPGLVRS